MTPQVTGLFAVLDAMDRAPKGTTLKDSIISVKISAVRVIVAEQEQTITALVEALHNLLADVTTPSEKWAEGSSVERARAALDAAEKQ